VLRASNLRNNIEQSHIASRTFNHEAHRAPSRILKLSLPPFLVCRA
jgi:hypothetical protein